jgi:hypothetical protein
MRIDRCINKRRQSRWRLVLNNEINIPNQAEGNKSGSLENQAEKSSAPTLVVVDNQFLQRRGGDHSGLGEQLGAVGQFHLLERRAPEPDVPREVIVQDHVAEMQPFEPARPYIVLAYAMADPTVGILADGIAYIQPELFQVYYVVAVQEDVDEVLETLDLADGVVISGGRNSCW